MRLTFSKSESLLSRNRLYNHIFPSFRQKILKVFQNEIIIPINVFCNTQKFLAVSLLALTMTENPEENTYFDNNGVERDMRGRQVMRDDSGNIISRYKSRLIGDDPKKYVEKLSDCSSMPGWKCVGGELCSGGCYLKAEEIAQRTGDSSFGIDDFAGRNQYRGRLKDPPKYN